MVSRVPQNQNVPRVYWIVDINTQIGLHIPTGTRVFGCVTVLWSWSTSLLAPWGAPASELESWSDGGGFTELNPTRLEIKVQDFTVLSLRWCSLRYNFVPVTVGIY